MAEEKNHALVGGSLMIFVGGASVAAALYGWLGFGAFLVLYGLLVVVSERRLERERRAREKEA